MKKRYRFVPIMIFTLAVVSFILLFVAYTRPAKTELALTPGFSDTNGWEMYTYDANGETLPLTLEEYLEHGDVTLYLTRTLPVSWEKAGYTTLKLNQTRSYAIFLEDNLIYSSVAGFVGEPGKISFPDITITPILGEALSVSLPFSYGGKQLTIVSKNQGSYTSSPSIFLSSQTVEQESFAALLSRQLMPGLFFGVLTLILFALLLLELAQGKFQLPLLLLLFSSLFETFELLNQLNMYLPAKTFFDSPLTGLIQPLFFHFPLLFFVADMKKCRPFFAPIALFSFISSLIPPTLNLFGVMTSSHLFWLPLYLVLPLFLVCSILEMRSGNENFRFVLKCLLLSASLLAAALLLGKNTRSYVHTALAPIWHTTPTLLIFWCGTLFLLFGLILSARNFFSYHTSLQTEKEMLLFKNRLAEENLSSIKENSRQLAEARHNFTHHLNVLSELVRAGDTEELESYLTQLTEETNRITPLKLTAHPAVNAVVTNALGRARQNGIKMDHHILLPETLPVSDIDLCNYLMNLLDNAIRAQKDVAENKKWISLAMHIWGGHLYIEASNALAHKVSIDEKSGLIISENGQGHGYGLKTMQSIAASYHSILSIQASENSIQVRTFLLLQEN